MESYTYFAFFGLEPISFLILSMLVAGFVMAVEGAPSKIKKSHKRLEEARRKLHRQLQRRRMLTDGKPVLDALTADIYDAARRVGLDPDYEMSRLRESVVYPIEFACGSSEGPCSESWEKGYCTTCLFSRATIHSDYCLCADCQIERLAPEDRTNITEEVYEGRRFLVAHIRTCVCDKCRFKLEIDAEKALELSRTQSTWTTSLSDMAMRDRCLVSWMRSNRTQSLRTN